MAAWRWRPARAFTMRVGTSLVQHHIAVFHAGDQAGADPHIDDPLGGWLTTRQLFERDRLVFDVTAKLEWNCSSHETSACWGGRRYRCTRHLAHGFAMRSLGIVGEHPAECLSLEGTGKHQSASAVNTFSAVAGAASCTGRPSTRALELAT